MPGALADLTVVDLGEMVAGPYAAKLLADFGAEVIKVEQPGDGDPVRRRGPFPHGRPDREHSGLFLYLNTNKYGLTLDPSRPLGRSILDRLLESADILVTNLTPERLAAWDLLPSALRERHPRLIVTTITPFGMDGPRAGWRGDELVTYAMGGLADGSPGVPDVVDDPEREPPLHPECFLAETVAGLVGAVATMLAVFGGSEGGRGRHVDVSQQAAVLAMDRRSNGAVSYGTALPGRLPLSVAATPNCYLPCKDGYVAVAAFLEHHWRRLVELIGNPEWARSELFRDGAARAAHWDALKLLLLEWTMDRTGDEIYRLAQARGLPLFPFYSVRRMAESDHVRERGSLVEVERDGHRLRMPSAPVQMRGTPWALRRPAPRHGEHTAEILRARLGYDEAAVRHLFAAGVV